MDRLETRELAYFLAVADELHFGRAAVRLGIAQPALSKAIRQLERRLGVILLERISRAVGLTEAGRVLAREARVALEAVSAGGGPPPGRPPARLARPQHVPVSRGPGPRRRGRHARQRGRVVHGQRLVRQTAARRVYLCPDPRL